MKLNHRLILCFFTLLFFCLAGCEDESVPVIPDPVQPEEPITEVPLPNGVKIKLPIVRCPTLSWGRDQHLNQKYRE
jgi:hypothetical protein